MVRTVLPSGNLQWMFCLEMLEHGSTQQCGHSFCDVHGVAMAGMGRGTCQLEPYAGNMHLQLRLAMPVKEPAPTVLGDTTR